jgi:hypothetical protein
VGGVDVLLRNLARPIDTLGPMGLIGLLLIFVTRRAQRLGDLMAQTLVIHETKIDWSLFEPFDPASGTARRTAPTVRLSAAQWELLHRFVHRRAQIEPESRLRVAQLLRDTLLPAVKGTELARSPLAPEEWLLELARRT